MLGPAGAITSWNPGAAAIVEAHETSRTGAAGSAW